MIKKRVLFFCLIVMLLFGILLNGFIVNVSAADTNTQINDGSTTSPISIQDSLNKLWGDIGTNAYTAYNATYSFLGLNFKKAVGARTFSGEGLNVASWDFWSGSFWYYLLTFSLPLIIFGWLFYIIFVISENLSNSNNPWESLNFFSIFNPWKVLSKIKAVWIVALFYPFLMGIPLINRALQVITLEAIGLHWFWRAFVWAVILFFLPKLWEAYVRYRTRMRKYRTALEKVAGEENAKALARGG